MLRRSLTSALLFTVTGAAAAAAGPSWISIEYPANPHHASTRGAALLVRTYHHSGATDAGVHGVAEGIVGGRRVSQPLTLRATSTPGVYALRSPLPKGGTWVLAISLAEHGPATALVTVDARGRVVEVDVPAEQTRDGWTVPRATNRSDIEERLQRAHALAQNTDPQRPSILFLAALPLLAAGALFRRRRHNAPTPQRQTPQRPNAITPLRHNATTP